MPVCILRQSEVYNSENYLDNLSLNTISSQDLETDLNYIRSVLRSINGTAHWYTVPGESIADLKSDFEVEHF